MADGGDKLLLQPFHGVALGQVAQKAGHHAPFRYVEGRQLQLERERAAALVPRLPLGGAAHGVLLGARQEVGGVILRPAGHQVAHVQADHLAGLVAEHALRRGIHQPDDARRFIHQQHSFEHLLDHGAGALLARFERLLLGQAHGHVADKARKDGGAAGFDADNRDLDWNRRTVGHQGRQLQPFAENPRLPGEDVAREAGFVLRSQCLRHNQVREPLADRLLARPAEHALRRRVELLDVTRRVDGQNRVEGRIEDGAQPRSLSDEAGLRANARDHLAKLRAD